MGRAGLASSTVFLGRSNLWTLTTSLIWLAPSWTWECSHHGTFWSAVWLSIELISGCSSKTEALLSCLCLASVSSTLPSSSWQRYTCSNQIRRLFWVWTCSYHLWCFCLWISTVPGRCLNIIELIPLPLSAMREMDISVLLLWRSDWWFLPHWASVCDVGDTPDFQDASWPTQ